MIKCCLAFLVLLISVQVSSKVVSRLNQIEEDPAVREVDMQEDQMREVLDDLDEPRAKPKEKSPNEVQFEKQEDEELNGKKR